MCKTAGDNDSPLMVSDPCSVPESTRVDQSKPLGSSMSKDMSDTSSMLQQSDIVPEDRTENSARVESVRRRMLKLLKNHLEKSPDSTAHSKKAEALAKRLDTILFREASSLHEYADVYTLESRMNALLTHVLGRCIQKAASQEHSSRERALRTILGKDRLRKVVKLVRTIKRMRLVPNATNDVAAATNGVVSPPPRSSDIGLTAMHKPVRDLFLNTPIVSVFELASPENFINVPWDELIAQGNKVVEDCRVWIQQAKQQADSIPLTNSNIVSPTDDLKAAAGEIADPFGPQCLL